MEDNVFERSQNIRDLTNMLDVVTNNSKQEIISGKKEIVDIIKHSDLTFDVKEKDETIEFTKTVYEIISDRDGKLWHEFYDDQGLLLVEISDDEFQKGKILSELGQGVFDDKSLISSLYERQDDKSLSELELEQNEEIATALGMDKDIIKELDILTFDDKSSSSEKSKEVMDKITALESMGFSIDTSELATSEQTIKKFLNIDADRLLVVKVNSEWKALKITDKGTLEIEDNLQIVDNSKSFSTINHEGTQETRKPTVEFRRKDNPDYSLAIDNSKEEKTEAFLVVGESRTASEIEINKTHSPYADAKNNELMQEAAENPDQKDLDFDDDIDPHEPDEPTLEQGANHY